jgi:hypothetical protein
MILSGPGRIPVLIVLNATPILGIYVLGICVLGICILGQIHPSI